MEAEVAEDTNFSGATNKYENLSIYLNSFRITLILHRASLVAQTVKCLQCGRLRFNSWVRKIHW